MSDNKIDDGGPAFPVPPFTQPNGDFDWGRDGMSLREYFAGQALMGILANPASKTCTVVEHVDEAYLYATTMMEYRKR